MAASITHLHWFVSFAEPEFLILERGFSKLY